MRLRNIPGADEVIHNHQAVINNGKDHQGRWQAVFGREALLHIEIGMGKGQFLLNIARQNPEIDYVGIERYSSVLYRALERCEAEEFSEIGNVRFLCLDAMELPEVFAKEEVDRIYLNFSDPWPKARHARRRLTSAEFLKGYEQVLAIGGRVEFKTDNRGLFDFSVEQVENSDWNLAGLTYDLHHNSEWNAGNIMTEYEEKFSALGQPIHKLVAVRI